MARRKAPPAESPGLTEAQRRAVDLLALGQRVGDVAQAVGATPEAIAEWRQTPLFMAAINAQLQGDPAAPPQLRLQAALRVLDLVGAKDYAKAEIGSTDPADVAKEQQRDRFMKDLF